jgi:hypothetical protein
MSSRDEYVETIKKAALTAGKHWVMEYIVRKVAFFSLSFPNAIMGILVGKVLEIAIMKTELGAFFLFIDLRTSAQGRAFYKAAIKNKLAQESGNKEEQRLAELEVINTARPLIKFAS